jgi:hypothetical protein
VRAAKLVHKLLPERGAALFEQLGANAQRGSWAGGEAPAARTRVRVGSRVRSGCARPLAGSRVLTAEQSQLEESLESVGENI